MHLGSCRTSSGGPCVHYAGSATDPGSRATNPMKILGIVGHSGMGKTTLLERLVPELVSRGLRVSLIKHTHKDIDVDHPGKDSHRLREAGCGEVLLAGRRRWALMHELRQATPPTLDELLARLAPCDLVLIEGFKTAMVPKIEVWRAVSGTPPLAPALQRVVALATDAPEYGFIDGLERLDLADLPAIADCALRHASTWPPATNPLA